MRFSLMALLVATGAIAIVCGVFFALPDIVSVLVLFALSFSLFPSMAVSGIVYGQNHTRAFAIGCAASMAASLIPIYIMLGDFFGEAANTKIFFAIYYSTILLSGAGAVFVRGLCIRSRPVLAQNQQPAASIGLPDHQMTSQDRAELYAILQGRLATTSTRSENWRNGTGVANEAAHDR